MKDVTGDSLILDNQLCFKLYAASRAVTRAYKPLLEQLGLTYPQYLVMLVLWQWRETEMPHPTVKALGERLSLDSGTLTPLLKRLEQLSLVQRQRSASDEREVHLSLAKAGKALREQVPSLKARVLCESGVDLRQVEDLRRGLDQLLMQLRGSS